MKADLLAHWAEVEPLLDQALALPPAQRESFLSTLPPDQQRWREALSQLLQAEAQAAQAGFLERAASLPGLGSTGVGAVGGGAAHQPGEQIGPWVLIEELGRGGMASVWRARPHSGDFQREVALKLPHSPAPGWLERLKRERDILARLQHVGIARLYDAGADAAGLPWLAMECVQGTDILSWCEACQASTAQRVALLLQVADALQYAHSHLVIHRDIKPANVLVQDDGQVRLLDFGIARWLNAEEGDAALTQLGQRPMTPEYASPEQVRGEEPGIASDVYALGVLAYRLLSGASPYAGAAPDTRHALERAVLEALPPPPSSAAATPGLRKALRGDLDAIVGKALAKETERRYPTMDALAADLRRYLAGEAVLARPPSWRYRAGRVIARHRWAVGASTLAVLALVGTTGWALQSAHQARQEARRSAAMYEFLTGLFNPDHDQYANVKKPDLSLRQLIEIGAQRVLTQLQDQPEVRAGLMQDLTPLTEQLGLIQLSTELARTRVEDARRLHGERSLAYADALRAQLHVLESSGENQRGYDTARQALAIYEAHGIKDPGTLALVHEKIGGFGFRVHPPSPDDAAHLERAIALLTPLEQVSSLGQTYLLLAMQRAFLGELPAAYTAGQQAVAISRQKFGAESWQAGTAESLLGSWADMVQRPDEAERLLRHALTVAQQTQGADHVAVARAEISLASVLFAGSRRDEAEHLLADALRITQLPANAGFSNVRDQVAVGALSLAARREDAATLREGCEPYRQQAAQAASPYTRANVVQACAFGALLDGELARAAQWLTGSETIDRYFEQAPVWSLALNLRRGELALARGDQAEALRRWRLALASPTTAQLPAQARAWWQLARHTRLSAEELARLQALLAQLQQAGGEAYYAAHLALLRSALEAQQRS